MSNTTLAGQTKDTTLLFANGSLTEFDTAVEKRFFERDGKRVLELSKLPVFRSGTFRDSMGQQHAYDDFHLKQFVVNFDHLSAQGVFKDVPVRKGHPSFGTNRMDDLIGYVTALSTEKRSSTSDGVEQTYLLAKVEILDAAAQDKIDSGLYRNRSAEVGTYVDNNEAEYAPTFMGVAYVDIPAVEGLNGFAKTLPSDTSYMMEDDMSTKTLPVPPATGATVETAAPHAFSIGGTATTDYAAVQEYVTNLESQVGTLQSKVDAFHKAETDRQVTLREEFVNGLVTGGQILAPKLEATMAFAKGLTEEQFANWSEMQSDTPPNPLLGTYGHQDQEAGHVEKPSDFDTQLGIVKNLAMANVTHDAIMRSPAYAKVIAADPSFQIPSNSALGQ